MTNFTNPSFVFGWYIGGNQTVNCDVTITTENGQINIPQLQTSASVVKPMTTIQLVNRPLVTVDTDWQFAVGPALHCGTTGNAMQFTHTSVSVSQGSYDWLQIGNINRSYSATNPATNIVYAGSGLDGPFPEPVDASGNYSDDPGQTLPDDTTGLSNSTANDTFTTYIMFLPNGDQSFYVPIWKTDWFWKGTAIPDTNSACGWSLAPGSGSSGATGSSEASDYPSWSTNTTSILTNPLLQ